MAKRPVTKKAKPLPVSAKPLSKARKTAGPAVSIPVGRKPSKKAHLTVTQMRARETENAVWKLKLRGHSNSQIAEALRIDPSTVAKHIKARLTALDEDTEMTVDSFRKVAMRRLEEATQVVMKHLTEEEVINPLSGAKIIDPKTLKPMVRDNPDMVNPLVKIIERQSKLLGADSPQKVEHSGVVREYVGINMDEV